MGALNTSITEGEPGRAERASVVAKKAVSDLAPEMRKIEESLEDIKKQLCAFQDGPLAMFAELKELAPPPPPPVEDVAMEADGVTQAAEGASLADEVASPEGAQVAATAADDNMQGAA